MEATHLRIGNLVYLPEEVKQDLFDSCYLTEQQIESLKNQSIYEVASIDKDQLNLYIGGEEVEFNYPEIESISLDDDNILELGFFKRGKSWYYSDESHIFNSNFSKDIDGFFIWVGGFKKYVRDVHQLQNLFFSLTETELSLAKNKTETNNSLETES